jgi:hypothetical protein
MAGDTDLKWLPPEHDRRAEGARLATDYPELTAQAAAVDVLYTEAKEAYQTERDRFKALDDKASTLLGIVTTGLGAVSILGDPSKAPDRNLWFAIALVSFGLAFALALAAHMPRGADTPALKGYALQSTLAVPDNAVRIKYDLTLAWLRDRGTTIAANQRKARLLLFTTALLAVGLLALALNFVLAQPPANSPAIRVMIVPTPTSSPVGTKP